MFLFGSALIRIRFGSWKVRRLNWALKTKFKAFARENEPVFSAEAPAGYPNKNSNNQKIESARGTMGGGKNLASSLSPSHCPPRAFFFLFSSLPTLQRGLCGGEREWAVFEDVRVFDISNAFKRKVYWNGLQKCHLEGSLGDFSEEGVYMQQVFRLINLGALVCCLLGDVLQSISVLRRPAFEIRWCHRHPGYCWFSHDVTKIQTTKL